MPVTRSQSTSRAQAGRPDHKKKTASLDTSAAATARKRRISVRRSASVDNEDDFDVELFGIEYENKTMECEKRGRLGSAGTEQSLLVFTHGAGGDLSTPAAKDFADGFGCVAPIVSFKGVSNIKSRVKGFNAVMDSTGRQVNLGGRSMGARAAVMAALEDNSTPRALVLVSYPLQGGGKNDDERRQILVDLPDIVEVLFITGTADSMCDLDKLNEVRSTMQATSWMVEVEGADHGMNMKPKKAGTLMRRKTGEIAAHWLKRRDSMKRHLFLNSDADGEQILDSGWKSEEGPTESTPPIQKRKRGT